MKTLFTEESQSQDATFLLVCDIVQPRQPMSVTCITKCFIHLRIKRLSLYWNIFWPKNLQIHFIFSPHQSKTVSICFSTYQRKYKWRFKSNLLWHATLNLNLVLCQHTSRITLTMMSHNFIHWAEFKCPFFWKVNSMEQKLSWKLIYVSKTAVIHQCQFPLIQSQTPYCRFNWHFTTASKDFDSSDITILLNHWMLYQHALQVVMELYLTHKYTQSWNHKSHRFYS